MILLIGLNILRPFNYKKNIIKYMLRYWTFWNLSWFTAYKFGLVNNVGPLRASALGTSLMGIYLTYIYPKRIVMKINEKRYELSYQYVVLFDMLFHQLPLLNLLFFDKNKNSTDICGLYVAAPTLSWIAINKFRQIDQNKIYGVDIKYLVFGALASIFAYGLVKHRK